MLRRTLITAAAALSGCASVAPPAPVPPREPADGSLRPEDWPPAPAREFRAAWVATVANIDWPSRPGLPGAMQQREALALLDLAQRLGLNALVLQVRPAADALYPSALEPWSEFLSGTQGEPPAPAWDPLAFWVEQAHRRGLELHAWFNPYRARHPSARSALAASHIARRRPDLVRSYAEWLWMDPGEPEAATHTLAVVEDVLRRYDIDGVHIDDYFYPYPVADQPFPDDPPWVRYLKAGGGLARDDWRRDNVDRLVRELYATVRRVRPAVRVGISPFGIGRPSFRPPGIEGFSQYDRLYADVERWLAEGWLDYLAPQLYWPIERRAQAFAPLLDYWLGRNPQRRHVWPGLFTSAIGRERDPFSAGQITRQIELLRSREQAGGHLHFSIAALQQDRDGIATRLAAAGGGLYAQPALVPATPWLAGSTPPPAAPTLISQPDGRLGFAASSTETFQWAVWRRRSSRPEPWRLTLQPRHDAGMTQDPLDDAIAVQAVDRLGRLSPPATRGFM